MEAYKTEITNLSNNYELRIALIGKTGSGKSSTANTILGVHKFVARLSFDSQTSVMQAEENRRFGKKILVVDTPGLFDTKKEVTNEDILNQIKAAFVTLRPGPHAIILVIRIGRYGNEDRDTANIFVKCFGQEMLSHFFVIFTGGDELGEQNIHTLLKNTKQEELQKLVRHSCSRIVAFNNNSSNPSQVKELIEMIEANVRRNGGMHYSNAIFKEIEKKLKEENKTPEPVKNGSLESSDLRIIIFGISGSGVSSTGNTILGHQIFETGTSFSAVTTSCKIETAKRFGKRLTIVDTPGFPVGMDENRLDETFFNLRQAVKMLEPGPNIFLLVVSVERFTEDHKFMVRCMQQLQDISKFTIVAFNRVDCLQEAKFTIMKHINNSETLGELLQLSSRRFVLFDNTTTDEIQVKALFEMADDLIRKNHHSTLTEGIFSGNAINQVNAVVNKRQEDWKNAMNVYGAKPSLLQRICRICNIL
ncbi:unnamed protein product [Mytilus coruscus]|uniref:AIG1-type G domain-containing protein n=1 Tax=Mytilus coruscus TaxID=42192 RepID=A0A6J8DL56_MYTCO|nr:unnamed protein product [Mytilus coruscus]